MIFGISEWWSLLFLVVTMMIAYFWNVNQFFKRRSMKHMSPTLVFGSMFKLITGQKHTIDLTKEIYEKFPEEKYVGFFNFLSPSIIVTDLDLIKKIMVKDFSHFTDHVEVVDETVDPLLGSNLFTLEGEKWRIMRTTLSPAFTGAKMRGMIPFMVECSEIFVKYIEREIASTKDKKCAEFEMKDLASRFTSDVIASCAFGIKADSVNEKKNDFFMFAKNVTYFTIWTQIKLYIYTVCPFIIKILKLKVTYTDSLNYFRALVENAMTMREEKKIMRNDMIHLLMLAKKGSLNDDETKKAEVEGFASVTEMDSENKTKKTEWSDDEIIAQALAFVFAGFDTVSTVLGFLMHELAMHPDVQKKLQEEIDEFFDTHGNNIDYSDLNKMKYMDMVISEILRLWPPAPVADRKCVKQYTLPPQNDADGKTYTMNKGDGLWISIRDIQLNPKYHKNPHMFDPERFSDENKRSIQPYTYMPFGGGPRVCIGSRFALTEIKLFALFILRNFNVVQTSKTCRRIVLKPDFFDRLISKSGLWLGFEKRNENKKSV